MNNTSFAILAELATKQAIPADTIARTLRPAKVKNAAANGAARWLVERGTHPLSCIQAEQRRLDTELLKQMRLPEC